MQNHRYTLEQYRGPHTRHKCPACGVPKQFVRYIDTETNQHLADHIGRCNREYTCGYHAKPKEYFVENPSAQMPNTNGENSGIINNKQRSNSLQIPTPKETSTIPEHVFKETMGHYKTNHFVHFLNQRYGWETTSQLILRYNIGTSHHWDCSTVFWQVDVKGNIRTGKVMLYRPDTGKRLKQDGQTFVTWMHKVMKYEDYHLKQCLFGEHLLNTCTLPVAIVESEKTAIIASLEMPKYLWLATGGLQNLSAEKLAVYKGRQIILFPDAGAYDKWAAIGATIPKCKTMPFLEEVFTQEEKEQGLDIADFLMKKTG